jgi:hypothetical protein
VDTQAFLAIPRQRVQSADFSITGRLVRVEESGTRLSSALTVKGHWFPGVLRVLVEVSSPAEARSHILFEMRPDGRNSIRIAHPGDKAPETLPYDKWIDGPLGPGFSYEDFLEPQYFWHDQTALKEARFGSRDCMVIRSTPSTANQTHYAEVTSWLDKDIGFPVYVEKTIKGPGTVKEFTYFGLRKNGGVWSASQIEAKVRGRSGSTQFIVDRGSAKANLRIADFSTAQLIHF